MALPKICGGFLNVTQRCNLACKYCFVVQQPMEMTYEVAKDCADFYARNALLEKTIPNITFFGGEPMLRYEDIVKPLIEYIRDTYGDYQLDITTNGTLLNEERLKFFKKNDVGILLSIDGDRKTQDLLRIKHDGSGSFDDIDVKAYLKYNPYGTFRSTLDPRNVKYMYENYLWAKDIGYKSCTMIINVFEEWTEEDYRELARNLSKIMTYIENNDDSIEFTEVSKYKRDLELLESGEAGNKRVQLCNTEGCGNCGLGAGRFASCSASGNLYSCQEMTENEDCDDFIIGNIYDGVDDEKRYEVISRYHISKVESSKVGRCESCSLKLICNGGCVINNYFKNGDLNVMSEPLCVYSEMCFESYKKLKKGKVK
ncbi:radical SAM/SPASM domain-containing protein [Peptoniphilus duerdenii]|uniref:radical SAM/SPASM domain-containing protein n=1 Tax=Peptoniphilus duerdenii TaxID=507750 RepID=UPI00288A450C|nr:radical SAM protein [Peptoniphilus duerdenii]